MCSSVCVLPYVTTGTSNSTSGTTMVHSSTLHLLYLYYSTINICTINGTSGTTNSIDRSSNSHFLVNIYYTFIKNVPTLLASHDSSPICWRTVGTVPNVAYVPLFAARPGHMHAWSGSVLGRPRGSICASARRAVLVTPSVGRTA